MKGLKFAAAFLGGVAIGAVAGLLFAPEKGEDTRKRIADYLREKGLSLNKDEIEELIHKMKSNKTEE
ncbi:MAG: YtxH domain-containing protein [Phocaeicola sp.]|nr:YtxH domain-containing protein [Phocaeicola sp.]MDD7448273.1 YtxH domain-containing protein [Prevotellaceae bacterium]MDY3914566.1 YtxH domain-containing protein [Phocaeicola sp.]MDY5938488.1 YtxH domain-containing protein [Phocaeicola sp.]